MYNMHIYIYKVRFTMYKVHYMMYTIRHSIDDLYRRDVVRSPV